jgi:hypothetical protein
MKTFFTPALNNAECENRVLRRILALQRDEVTGGWRKLCSKYFHN